MPFLHADALFDGQHWLRDVSLSCDAEGRLASLKSQAGLAQPSTPRAEWVLPGIANLHSHAFQRAMAGLAERQSSAEDSFWTWRDWMYRFASVLSPDDVHVIARQLYIEMLEAGYTSVCEFHYLHHDLDGRAYAPPTAMAEAIISAAHEAGIRLTLLPVLYQRGGFDDRPLSSAQQRFGHSTEAYLRLLHDLSARRSSMLQVGVAFHSLRAVGLPAIRDVLSALPNSDTPVHIHIAEQQVEVDECLAAHGQRPVARLLEALPVDSRWCLVHATHLDAAERAGIAQAGAVVALCPSTEGNLGDGLFPLRAFLADGGRYGIGSDSHVAVSPVEELRWLEYGQRLIEQKRSRALLGPGSTAQAMLAAVSSSAANASGHATGGLHEGQGADCVVLDENAAALAAARVDDVLDRWVFGSSLPMLRDVYVGGQRRVSDGRHTLHDSAKQAYAATLRRVLAE